MSNIAFFTQVLPPLFIRQIFNNKTDLPICNYFFVTDEDRENYYYLWFLYQSVGMYGHMTYNVNIDSFLSGLMFLGVGQFKALNYTLANLKYVASKSNEENYDQIEQLKRCLKHYDVILM